MSTVEEMQKLVEQLKSPDGALDSLSIRRIVKAYETVGTYSISQIVDAYRKVGQMKRDGTKEFIRCTYVTPDKIQKDVLFARKETDAKAMRKILQMDYGIPEDCAVSIDYFLRRAFLGDEIKPYSEVLKEIMKEDEASMSQPEHYFEEPVPRSERGDRFL
jgi:hypothetical protein